MNENLWNVNAVWHEYAIGLSGCPSVKDLEQEHKAPWRVNRTESSFSSSRSIIYREIETKASKLYFDGISEPRRIEFEESIDELIRLLKLDR